jgi:XisI protein
MEDLIRYRRLVRDIINKYAKFRPAHGDVHIEVVCDEDQDHYELIYSGWHGYDRIHGSVLHIDIIDGKIWIQHNGVEDGVADELVDAGVPKDRIVLAFKSPELRKHTGFAVA